MERKRQLRYINLGQPSRFWEAVQITDSECWEWQGYIYPNGYGRVYVPKRGLTYAHRYAFELANGYIDDDLLVCHTCDNRRCINPAHLWLGTYTDNNRDREQKGRGRRRKNPDARPVIPRRRLTIQEVQDIRRIYRAGGISQKSVGQQFGVSVDTVQRVLYGKEYKCVPDRS